MIVQCDSCHVKYRIADEKVRGKAVKIKCAKCGHIFTVKPASSTAPDTPSAPKPPAPPAPEEPLSPEEPPDPATPLPREPAPQAPPELEPAPHQAASAPDDPIGTYQPPVAGDENLPIGHTSPAAPAPGDEPPPIGGREPLPAEPSTAPHDIGLTDGPAPPPSAPPDRVTDQDNGLPPLGDIMPGAEEPPVLETPTPAPTPAAAGPGGMDWGNIALDSPQEAGGDIGLAGASDYQPPPPPPVPVEEPSTDTGTIPEFSSPAEAGTSQVPTYQPTPGKRSGGGKGIFILLIIIAALATGGYYFVYPRVQQYLGAKKTTASQGLTIINQTAATINREDGNIVSVVRGDVRNGSAKSVGLVEVMATFLDGNDQVKGQSTAFCGNTFTDEELRAGEMEQIRSELQNELGQEMRNNSIKPGATVPFMVILENSPLNIKRAKVKVRGYKETT